MDPTEIRAFMDMYGHPLGFSLSPFALPRYPPAAKNRFLNPVKLKDTMIKEDPMFSSKLHDFQKMYLKHATGLLDMSSNAFLPGHPLNRSVSDLVNDEIEKLRKENAELKNRIEQLKTKKQI
ncbi:MAG: hypothetical protein ABI337_01515 [Nitrososphaera sp.]|jgi:hypothetical protein